MRKRVLTIGVIVGAFLFLCSRGTGRTPTHPNTIVQDPREFVVKIVTPTETGAGLVVHLRNNDAFILTAYHVVEGSNEIAVTFFKQRDIEFKNISVLKFYEELDIAVIKVTGNQTTPLPSDLPKINIGAVPKVNDKLSTIGHPGGLDWQFDKDAYPYTRHGYETNSRKFLFEKVALQLGGSGGPVLDASNGVVGLVLKHHPAGYAIAVTINDALWVLGDWGVETSNLATLPTPPSPNFVVEVYEGSRTNSRNGVLVTLRNLITRSTQQEQTDASGDAQFSIADRTLCQVSLLIRRNDKLVKTVLAADQNVPLPHVKEVDLSKIPDKDWKETNAEASWTDSVDFALVSFQNTNDLTNVRWPIAILGDPKLKSEHLPWGVPKTERILYRKGYVLGYDPEKRIPRWTAYRINLSASYVRQDFAPDPDIPGTQQAKSDDYRGSGYDRGHLISAFDIAGYGKTAVTEANYLSTIAPQYPQLNKGLWFELEEQTRALAADSAKQVWVIAGTAFISKYGKVNYQVIGPSKVAVPDAFFRIVVVQDAASAVTVGAFLMRNVDGTSKSREGYLTTIDAIEAITGLDFFSDLDKETQERLEGPGSQFVPIKLPRIAGN